MNRKQALEIIVLLRGAWPHQPLEPAAIEMYVQDMMDLEADVALAALEEAKVKNPDFRPTVGAFRLLAKEIDSPDQLLAPDEAWGEVQREIARIGLQKRGTLDFSTGETWEPSYSHPLVGRIADNMGWKNLCLSENGMADRAHFLKLYADASTSERQRQAMTPRAEQLRGQIGARKVAELTAEIGKALPA